MTFGMHRVVAVPFVALTLAACSAVRTERASRAAATAEPASSGAPPAVLLEATAGNSPAASKAEARDPALCEIIAERLRFVEAWRARPEELFASKPMLCGQYAPMNVCGRTSVDDDGPIGVGFIEDGPGAQFYFELDRQEKPRVRLTCETLGLSVGKQIEPGVERCGKIEKGGLAKMTTLLDSRCDDVRLILFDDPFLAQHHAAGDALPCVKASPERLVAPRLVCGPFPIFAK